jgi:hypothetical protein
MRTSISFFPNVAKRNSKTGRIPIYLRVIHNGQKAEARLNENISIKDLPEWDLIIMRLDASFYTQGTNGDTVQLIKKIYRA